MVIYVYTDSIFDFSHKRERERERADHHVDSSSMLAH